MLTCFAARKFEEESDDYDQGDNGIVRIHCDTDDEFVHMEVRRNDAQPAVCLVLTVNEARRIANALLAGCGLAGINER